MAGGSTEKEEETIIRSLKGREVCGPDVYSKRLHVL